MRSSSLRSLFALTAVLLAGCGSDDGNNVTLDTGGTGGAVDTGGSGGTGAEGGSNPSGGSSAGGGGAGGAPAQTCADLTCTAPATCDDGSGTARCVCPTGYADTNDDGSQCDDVDECADGTDDCDANATCTNTDGGFDCACDAPAYDGDGSSCSCATGYLDVSGACLKDDIEICTDATECASGNCVGGVCCAVACDSPGPCEQLTNTVCVNGDTCRYGLVADDTACDDGNACTATLCSDGECIVIPEDSVQCSDGDSCTTDSCNPTTGACETSPTDCDDANPCTDDSCDSAAGCQYVNNDAASCTDGDSCTTDVCQSGVCQSTAIDCSGLTNGCNEGICNNGTCLAQAANQGGDCTDALGACDASGTCDTSGNCVGADDACGPLASSCTTAGCPGDPDCFQGRLCTCGGTDVLVSGTCEEDTNECNAGPCDSLAACSDPTPGGSVTGDYVCTCPAGYTGGGVGTGATACADIDECSASTDPCGPGVAGGGCNGSSPAGSYSCTCASGYTSVPTPSGPFCACDMSGTYEMITTATFHFDEVVVSGITATEGSGTPGLETTSWALRHHTVESDGTMTVKTIPCGGTSPTVCSAVVGQALAQYQGNDVWGKSNYNAGFRDFKVSLAGVAPGGALNEPQTASLAGITLTDPAGAWPLCQQCIGLTVGQYCCQNATACTTNADCTAPRECNTTAGFCAYKVTNRAQWFDSDENGARGISTWAVRDGGEPFGPNFTNDPNPDPPLAYTEPSVCPRFDPTNPPAYPYGAWPGLATVGGLYEAFHTLEWRGATRVISQYVGDTIGFQNGACVVTGSIAGPDAGRPQTDARIGGCQTTTGATGQSATGQCKPEYVTFFDEVDQIQEVVDTGFTLRKSSNIDLDGIFALATESAREAALSAACQELRATACPAGADCTP